jgi:pilus assembly protein FimV
MPIVKKTGANLDQVLFVLYQDNSTAIGKNMNRLKVGTEILLPIDSGIYELVPRKDAQALVLLHSKNFAKYKQALSGNVASVSSHQTGSMSSGQLGVPKTSVHLNETSEAKGVKDRLVLSGGKSGSQAGGKSKENNQEEKIAQSKSVSQTEKDINVLQKNINDAKGILTPPAVVVPTPSSASTASSSVPPQVASAAQNTATASQSSAAVAPVPKRKPIEVVDEQPPVAVGITGITLIDDMISSPYVLIGILLILVLIIAYVVLNRIKKKRQKEEEESSNSSMDEDDDFEVPSFNETSQTHKGSGMNVFQPHPSVMVNQTNSIDTQPISVPNVVSRQVPDSIPVPPVETQIVPSVPKSTDLAQQIAAILSEADTYIQYKQYQDAERLLSSSSAKYPDQILLRQKIAEIYALMGNRDAFEGILSEFLQSASPEVDWKKLSELQALLDSNANKGNNNQTTNSSAVVDVSLPVEFPSSMESFTQTKLPTTPSVSGDTNASNLHDTTLLDPSAFISSSNEEVSKSIETQQTQQEEVSNSAASNLESELSKFDFSSIDLSLDEADKSHLEKDTGGGYASDDVTQASDPLMDSLSTKLELARAYKDIGDIAGAKQLLQEVAASGKAEFVDKAKIDLKNLGVE